MDSFRSVFRIDLGFKTVECVGQLFISYLSNNDEQNSLSISDSEEVIFDPNLDSAEDYEYLRSLDPKKWKEQDHYAVLGLKDKRFNADFSEIRTAYRQRVLKHHPDKRGHRSEVINLDDDYFTCITKAWETLGSNFTRRSYDSVDPTFDNDIPSNTDHTKKNFFEVFDHVFKLNARWSEKTPVPHLGGPDDPREKVDKFYSFWYNFESWREFSYEDEESKDRAQDREERKWIEKQNKAVRAKKKKEEMTRIRNLVDMAYNLDPRIAKFKLDDKERKEAQKRAKAEAVRARQEQIERAQQEEEEKRKQEEEKSLAAEKERQNALKAERDLQKRLLKKERKFLRDVCKSNNYYINSPDDLVKHVEYIEKMCEALELKELEELNENLKTNGKPYFFKKVEELEDKLQQQRQNLITQNNVSKKNTNGYVSGKTQTPWTQSQINLLIKAVNLFPAGTNQRWEVVANFINQHSKNGAHQWTAKEVLSKAKELQTNGDFNVMLKKAANQKAFSDINDIRSCQLVEEVETSQRFESVAEQQGISLPWTSEEQKLLEQALKTYTASVSDRWEQIASCIPTRTKKDIIKRYKELVEMVKAKKAAEKPPAKLK